MLDKLDPKNIGSFSDNFKKELMVRKSTILAFIEEIEIELIDRISSGEKFSGFEVKAHQRRRINEKGEIFLLETLGDEAYAPAKLITLLKAEKKLRDCLDVKGYKMPDDMVDVEAGKISLQIL